MKRLLYALIFAAVPVFASDVGVSISIGEPGFYGRIDIGDYPAPRLIYREPVVIERVLVGRPPIYLHVPPGHAKNWRKHCHEYRACGERVYFVHDGWYEREYIPRYKERHGKRHDDHRDYRDDRRDDRRDYKDERHDRDRDRDRDHR